GLGAGKVADSIKNAGDAAKDLPKPDETPKTAAAVAPPGPSALPPVDQPVAKVVEPPSAVVANPAPADGLNKPEPKGLAQAGPEAATPEMPKAAEADRPASLKNADSLADSKNISGKGKAGLPVAQADWPNIPNGKGRVLRSIAAPARAGANTIAMAGATATGVGLGMAAGSMRSGGESGNNAENAMVASVQPINSADIAPIKHVVQSGENFWTISRDYYGSGRYFKALWSANRQQVVKIDQLHVGDTIRIPAMESLDKSLVESPNVAGKRQMPADDQPEAVARSRDNRAVRTANEIESTPTEATAAPKRKSVTPQAQPQRPGEIISEPVGETAARASATGGRRHRVQQGETLRTIARDFLGDARRSSEIIALNSDFLEDSRSPLRPGQVLRMPADSTSED
ncbi:MAG: LysM peptidoglycan-binding domain-containing protein, partial [Isosphaeraceae bacterium]